MQEMGVLSVRDVMSLGVFHSAQGLIRFVFGNELGIVFRFALLYLPINVIL